MRYQIYTESDLLQCFRPRDRKHVEVLTSMKFPLLIEHYVSWLQPAGVRLYLVFKSDASKPPFGIVFRRDQQGSSTSPARMCDWCHAMGTSDQVGLITAKIDAQRTVGVNACLDLSCLEKMRTVAQLSGQNLSKLIEAHRGRMAKFAEEIADKT